MIDSHATIFHASKSFIVFLILLVVLSPLSPIANLAIAASSPWSQTDWVGGSGQASWSDTTKYDSGSNVTTSTASQVTITPTEKFSNTGFETDLTGWSTTGTVNDSVLAGASGAIAAWPLDDTVTTQSYSRVLNPALSTGRNVVINGTMTTDTIWTKGTGWTITGGVAHSDGTGTSATLSQASMPITIGKSYSVSFTVSNYVSGNIRAQLGSTGNGTNRSANGTYTETLTASGNTTFALQTNTAFVGDVDDVSITQLNILASSSYTMPELLTDGDMESALTSSWTVANSATLSKQTTSPHGGTRLLRIARNGVNTPAAGQAVQTIGKTYRTQGYGRSDGSALPLVRENGTAIFTGTNSTSYQFFDVVRIAASTTIQVAAGTSTGTEYAEFDDVSTTELNPLSGRPGGGVTFGTSTGTNGHLTTAYTFDGTDDSVNAHSTDLNSTFNNDEGTAIVWAKVSGAGVWTDATVRYLAIFRTDSSNKIELFKTATSNQMTVRYLGANTVSGATFTASPTDWFQTAITWSKSADQVKVYLNGAQQGSTATGVVTWVGNLNSGTAAIGGSSNAGLSPWSGMINDVRLYNRALTASEILTQYTGTVTSRDTTTTYLASSGAAKIVAAADQQAIFTQSVNVGDTNPYNLVAYAYTDGSAVSSSDLSLYANGSTVSTTFTSVGSGWYKLSGTVTGTASALSYGVRVIAGKTVYLDNFSLSNYPTSATLTSSIFDTGSGSNWGTLTFAATTPTNTTATVKVRTSNDSLMSGATAFSSCTAISSGSDISSNGCVTDGQRYVQYLVTLEDTDQLSTPTFTSFSLTFAVSDATAPGITLTPLSPDPNSDNTPTLSGTVTEAVGTVTAVQFQVDSTSGTWTSCTASDGSFSSASESFSCTTGTLADGSHTVYIRSTDSNGNTTSSSDYTTDSFTIDVTAPINLELRSPGDNSYTNQERPSFQWRTATDATSGVAKYVLHITNAPVTGQPSGDFTIDNIPTSGTTDVVTNKYTVHFENFSDSDQTNNFISVQTKSSADWTANENYGLLREGKVHFSVSAVDNAGNTLAIDRPFFVDKTAPTARFTQINSIPFTTNNFSTTDTTPTMYGRLTDPLAGKIASGPKQVDIKIEKKSGLLYQLVSLTTQHMDIPWYTCDDSKVTDNSQQKCDKYLPFTFTPQLPLALGDYRITLTGKDKADNSASDILLYLHVKSGSQITPIDPTSPPSPTLSPTSSPVSRPTSLPQVTPKATSVPEEITVPEAPVGPTSMQKTGNFLSSLVGGILRGIGSAFGAVGNVIASIARGIGNTASAIARAFGNGYNALARGAPGILRTMLLAIGNGFGNVRNFIASIGKGINHTATSIAFAIGEKTQDVSHSLGMGIIEFTYKFVPEPTTISSVKVARATATTMTITWTTNHPATSKVNYGLTPDYGQDVQSQKRVTNHEVTITGLQPNTAYSYEVMSQNRNYVYDANHIFTTPAQ